MKLKIFTDGGSKGNPGPAAIGIVAYNSENKELFRHREDIGTATNNEAEYGAVVKALELIKNRGTWNEKHETEKIEIEKIDFYSDSLLLVNQLNGIYKVKKAHIRDFVFKIRILESELRIPTQYYHIKREENTLADALVNDEA